MAYTVKKLAQLSGISIRTLRFYDEIGLLKPAYYGDNHYRYYEEEQLLMLQQILFYRELGFPLNDILRIISSDDFNKIDTLISHKIVLEQTLDRTMVLIKTIDKTIEHLRGEKPMKLEDIFHGFNEEKQLSYENFLVEQGVKPDVIKECKNKTKVWTKKQWLKNKEEGDKIHMALVDAINHKLEPSSSTVQELIKKHYQLVTNFWIPNKESYIALSQFYNSHPDFIEFYDNIHPKLLGFLMEAMKIFAERELS